MNEETVNQPESDNLENYLVEVMESNGEVNQNIEEVGDDLQQVTENLEDLLKVMEQQEQDDQDQKEIQSSMRKTDLEFREQLMQQLGEQDGTDNDTLIEISAKLDTLIEAAETPNHADTVFLIYGYIVIPFVLISMVLWKMFKPFV